MDSCRELILGEFFFWLFFVLCLTTGGIFSFLILFFLFADKRDFFSCGFMPNSLLQQSEKAPSNQKQRKKTRKQETPAEKMRPTPTSSRALPTVQVPLPFLPRSTAACRWRVCAAHPWTCPCDPLCASLVGSRRSGSNRTLQRAIATRLCRRNYECVTTSDPLVMDS